MNLNSFKASAFNEPQFCHFRGPNGAQIMSDDKPVGVWLLGTDSDDLTKVLNRQTDRYLKAGVGVNVTAASARANEIELLVKAVVSHGKGWSGIVFDDEEWPCDEDHAAKLFREVPLFREQAGAFMRDRGNWQTA